VRRKLQEGVEHQGILSGRRVKAWPGGQSRADPMLLPPACLNNVMAATMFSMVFTSA
jgi:hypothetical protein